MDLELENEELWALIDEAMTLLEQRDPESPPVPGFEPVWWASAERWMKQAENLVMAKHRLSSASQWR